MSNLENHKPIFYTLDEASKYLGVTRGSILKYLRLGKIESIKRFGRRLIPERELARLWNEGTK